MRGRLLCTRPSLACKLRRQGRDIEVRHVAEVLAGEMAAPPIAGARRAGPRRV
ncbi:MAG: hypothetical protein SFW09_24245 [Hyphomicrobiaceae bacterium]|nr:hypothetical protein [Hyphomicrobiaceae bacterium]